jgi:hypothetical protein
MKKINNSVSRSSLAACALGALMVCGCLSEERDLLDDQVEIQELATCELHIGLTTRSGDIIRGYGSQANCGSSGRSYLTIQRSRWYGWEDLATATVIGSGHDVYVTYNCAGTGTHTFRTIHTGSTIGGTPLFKESNRITATCN